MSRFRRPNGAAGARRGVRVRPRWRVGDTLGMRNVDFHVERIAYETAQPPTTTPRERGRRRARVAQICGSGQPGREHKCGRKFQVGVVVAERLCCGDRRNGGAVVGKGQTGRAGHGGTHTSVGQNIWGNLHFQLMGGVEKERSSKGSFFRGTATANMRRGHLQRATTLAVRP